MSAEEMTWRTKQTDDLARNKASADKTFVVPWRDSDAKTLFSNDAYRQTLFLACGLSESGSVADPVLSFRQLAFVDMIIYNFVTDTAASTDHFEIVSQTEAKLEATFQKAGWTSRAPQPPFSGFSVTGYKNIS